MSHIDRLVERGVLEKLPDGRVRLTHQAWLRSTTDTKYQNPLVHFIGFKDDRFLSAIKVWGYPDFVHRFWDARAACELVPGDIGVFADGDETMPVREWAYDDSAYF